MLSAVFALAGAVVYGSADFFGGLAAKRLRSIAVTAIAALAGFVVLALALPATGGTWIGADLWWGALSGVFGAVAIALLYACLAIGPMSILSPLTAVVSAIAPMLWGLAVDGEELSVIGYAGLGVALAAVLLVGFIPGAAVVRPSLRGIAMAVGAGLAIGGFLIAIDQTSPDSGLFPLVVNRGVNTVITFTIVGAMMVAAVRAGRPASSALDARMPGVGATPTGHADLEHAANPESEQSLARGMTARRAWLLAIACGALDATANALMLLGLREGQLSIVSALTALYPAGTILLAAIVLHERVAAVQWAGLALALAAGGMLALA